MEQDEPGVERLFPRLDSVMVPLVLTVVVAIVLAVKEQELRILLAPAGL